MQIDQQLVNIINACIKVDSKASTVYQNLAGFEQDQGLRALWQQMAREELTHVGWWKRLLLHVNNGEVANIFENPLEIVGELEKILSDIDVLVETSSRQTNRHDAFFIACRLELFMLHSSFISMFYHLELVSRDAKITDEYEHHLSGFVAALAKRSGSHELLTLGNTINRLWQDNKRLVIQGTTDYLTGAFNRSGFFSTMLPMAHMAQRAKNNVAIIMIDCDHFKQINDTFGHQYGDKVLKFITSSIRQCIRSSDLLGRYGGEEFIVLLSGVQASHLHTVAENIRSTVASCADLKCPVTVSVGYAQKVMGREVDIEINQLIKTADDRLYQAKAAGRNMVVGDAV